MRLILNVLQVMFLLPSASHTNALSPWVVALVQVSEALVHHRPRVDSPMVRENPARSRDGWPGLVLAAGAEGRFL